MSIKSQVKEIEKAEKKVKFTYKHKSKFECNYGSFTNKWKKRGK